MNGTDGSIVSRAAFAVESRKTVASRVVVTTTVLLVVGICLLAGSLTD